ncbi:unnamed protein product [Cylindrotheca closterium]|uniref:U5 small nuclear ribonucleoprotein 200 kDa helicase n=1 Tax=Cylindrotheca closterium TaxID=2856 RepID=A0AAD2CJW6_9STRA|nr:unnamed protein product [Cylindrotheca closterium]
MEELLLEYEKEDAFNLKEIEKKYANGEYRNQQQVSKSISKFADALLRCTFLFEDNNDAGEEFKEGDSDVNAEWLLNICSQVPSELGNEQLAVAVWDASKLEGEGNQQDALFAALGASEEAVAILFEIVPKLPAIQRNIRRSQLGGNGNAQASPFFVPPEDILDEAELNRQKLRQEALDAAQVAAITKAEAEAALGPSRFGSTHTIRRTSDMKEQKMAQKAAKRAAQAMQRAKAAGAIIEESELLAVSNAGVVGAGGLMGHTDADLQALQDSLQPEGSRYYHKEEGLPSGTIREDDDVIGYEKVTIPPPILDKSKLHPRLSIDDILDPDCALAFSGTTTLNPMQSTVFDTAFNRRENMLVCAPTGAGKTNVAMLTVTAHFRDVGLIDGNNGRDMDTGDKVVYIAPMKALAQEVVEKFSSKLKPLGLIVRELTGDMQLTKAEANSANVIVTTPEKWDVVTRKSGSDENALGNQCGLLIFDEIHLLADESRGSVIESVISRLHRLVESRQKQLRIVGLSATLPNYEDVAEFLHVPERGLFYFGPEYRPVPLQQTFVGVTGNIKNRKLIEDKMNDVCYEEVKDALSRGYQVMVFVHSRKGTSDTATALTQRASAKGELDRYFVTQGKEGRSGDAYKRYADRAKKARSREVTNHFYNGIGIHHAGLLRPDRKLTETMFADGAIKVLCCTATLAWGVNLPAHNVIIKGTDVYNPEKGKNIDLSILDVQQIFGRAGRPQYDTTGEAMLITNHQAVGRYLDKLVRSVPIESSFIKQLSDHLNAEIVGGTVTNLNEAVAWLRYTYLSIRMKKNPLAYGISADKFADDPGLRSHFMELVRNAATYLSTNRMVNFDPQSGNLGMTTLGRVAAHFYIQGESVVIFNESMELKPFPTDADLLMLVASATEFENVRVRPEEQDELDNLQQKCPLELEGPINDSVTKTFVLLQMFISRNRPKGFTLISDTNYIASNAARVSRAIFEMCLHTNQAGTAIKMCRIAKSIDNQFWWFQTPLRYFDREVGDTAIKALESRHHGRTMNYGTLDSTLELLDMTPEEVGQICRSKKAFGQKIQRMIEFIPNPVVSCRVLPVTQHVLRFQVEIVPEFEWHGRWHGGAVSFWFWVEGSENQRIYHQEHVVFTKRTFPEPIKLDIPIPAFQGPGNQYLLRLISETWVGVEITQPISIDEIRMPQQDTVYTDLFDLTPLPTTALQDERYEKLFSRIETFNPVQTQLFHTLYHTNIPIFLGAPTGSGKTVIAELALLRMKKLHTDGICIYIAPLKSLARERLKEWRARFGESSMNWNVLELSGDTHHDQKALANADVLVCTPEKWDLISRNWRGGIGASKAFIKRVRLLIIDEIHLLGEERGAVLEAIVSRTRFISKFLQNQNKSNGNGGDSGPYETVRIVGLSTAIANPQDLSHWIGIDVDSISRTARHGLYNFRSAIRPVQTKIHIQGYPGKHYCPRMASMNKPCYAAIKQHAPDRPSLIFVASRRQTRLTAFDLISYAASEGNPKMFLGCSDLMIESVVENIQDEALRHTLAFGIGLHHAGLVSSDRDVVERMYLTGDIRVLVATATLAWGVNLPARLVIVKGTEFYDGKVSRYVDYPLTDVLQMIGRAGRPGFDTEGKAVVMVETSKKNFYKKFLYTPFPVESCLKERLCENLNAEIANGTVSSLLDATGYLTWTFFARRVKANPSYYGADSGSEEDVEAFLLSVATETVSKLKDQGCVVSEGDEVEDDLRPTTLGTTSSQFYLKYTSPKQMEIGLRECARLLMDSLDEEKEVGKTPNVSLRPYLPGERVDEVSISWLLYTLSFTPEFDELPVRHNEEDLNEGLSENLMWGADTAGVQSPESTYIYRSSDVYADPHTKGFLLIQAFLEKAQLPISDYVNDTRTVMDSVPRLLAAMHFVASNQYETDGYADVVSQLFRTKQLISTKSTLSMNPILQLPGISKKTAEKAVSELGDGAFWHLRQASRAQAEQHLKNFGPPKQRNYASALNNLLSYPKVTVTESKIAHRVDKVTVKSKGTLTLKIQIDRKKGSQDEPITLGIVVASNASRRLLGYQEVSISRNGNWTVDKSIDFDWEAARSDGGEGSGTVIVRLLLDSVKGLDSELLVKLV